jgi:UDP-N-acetylglucosamine--N-acetylmuramyl-(pentapeptide) pyrophosphoryl-undecaprenol N-acetylglucosamine transferase
VLIADRDLSGERLASELAQLCQDRARLAAMAERARRLARPDATATLAAVCLDAAGVAA